MSRTNVFGFVVASGAALPAFISQPACGTAAHPASLTVFDAPGAFSTQPISINDTGAITGYYNIAQNNLFQGFVRQNDGSITKIDVSGSMTTLPLGINNTGTIAGYYSDSSGARHGFLRSGGGTITTFDVPDATNTQANAINSAGLITGSYIDSAGKTHGFIRQVSGSFTFFDAEAGAFNTQPVAINDAGEVTGSFSRTNSLPSRGFIRLPNGKLQRFDGDPAFPRQTDPTSLNRAGTAVGNYISPADKFAGFVRGHGGMITTIGARQCPYGTFPNGINNDGEITGSCSKNQGTSYSYGFVLSPKGKFEFFQSGGSDTFADAINSGGVVIGTVFQVGGRSHGFVRTPASSRYYARLSRNNTSPR